MTQIGFSAPHYAAAEAGMDILQQGGNAIEAMVAAAATISVVYPHMTGLGGDGFWLIQKPGEKPVGIDASGFSAQKATLEFYEGADQIPPRGGKAALNVAGAVAGWDLALNWARENLQQGLFKEGQATLLSKLFNQAIRTAEAGFEVTDTLARTLSEKRNELESVYGFRDSFLEEKDISSGSIKRLPGLANLLRDLSQLGLDAFYTGSISEVLLKRLRLAGSPITLSDLADYKAEFCEVLSTDLSKGRIYNLGAPTQGIASLMILALYDRIYQTDWSEAEKVHALVESTKEAFLVRDAEVADKQRLTNPLSSFLQKEYLESLSNRIRMDLAKPWPFDSKAGDTVWMGCVDSDGVMVSYIQSLYWEFGSGVVIPEYDLVWNNRGVGFSLQEDALNVLAPRMKPFHTLNPALAELSDGRCMAYGTMGGEGQPQTQAAIFTRYVYENHELSKAISEPRWLLGRTWGDQQTNLKMESELFGRIGQPLLDKQHDIAVVADLSEMMGHAGAVVLHQDSQVESASDPRSDGAGLTSEFNEINKDVY